MKIYLATDHAGFELKNKVKEYLISKGYEVEDCGAFVFDSIDDYPDFIGKAAAQVSKDPINSRGIIFGGSGQGEAIVANRFPNVRCSLYYGAPREISFMKRLMSFATKDSIVRLSRTHNDANVISIAARFVPFDEARKVIELWLNTAFPGEERHVRRIAKIEKLLRA
jgi:ribose 5-phosphate isomerase B